MTKSFVMSAADADATMDSELPFTRGDQSITLPSAATRRGGEESTQ